MDFRRWWQARPIVIETWIELDGTPEIVWDLITDWERQGDWMLEAKDFVVISEQREGVGVEAEATVRIAGITTRDVVRVTGWEPPGRLAIEHAGWVSGSGEIFVTPIAPDRTHVFWRETLYPPPTLGPIGAFGLRLFKPKMRRIFQRDLRELAKLSARRSAR